MNLTSDLFASRSKNRRVSSLLLKIASASPSPAAGAQGEFAGVAMIRAYHDSRADSARREIIVPDAAHGTNPASAAIAGFDCVQLEKTDNGLVDLAELQQNLDDRTAVFMITNPNNLGLIESDIEKISQMLHENPEVKQADLVG